MREMQSSSCTISFIILSFVFQFFFSLLEFYLFFYLQLFRTLSVKLRLFGATVKIQDLDSEIKDFLNK